MDREDLGLSQNNIKPYETTQYRPKDLISLKSS